MDTGKVSDEFGHFVEYRGVTGTPRGVNGLSWDLVEERRQQPCGGVRPPPFSFLSPSSFPLLLLQLRKEGVLLPVGVGLPLARLLLGRLPPPPCSFIYGGRGAPHDTQVDLWIVP